MDSFINIILWFTYEEVLLRILWMEAKDFKEFQ